MRATYGEISENTVAHNGADGITLFYGDYYHILGNTVEGNSGYGINLAIFSDYNTVYGNNLSANVDGNGYGYQNTNTWDDSVSIGNYWDDYEGPGTYSIPGPGNNVDRYPLGPPVVLADHGDEDFQFGSSGASFTWNSFSIEPDYYTIYIEGVVHEEGSWDGYGITVNVNTSSLGIFNYTLFVNGTSGYSANDTVWVTIFNNPPTISSPINRDYNFDTTGHTLSWTMSDANPFGYYLYINEVLDSWGAWSGASPLISIDGLPIGTHNFTMMVNDTCGLSASDSVIVTVWDIEPFVDAPYGNIVYEQGTTGNSIYWNATDFNPANYTVYKNSSIDAVNQWNGLPITYSVDGLATGIYNYTIVIVDTSGQTAINTVLVTVQEASTTPTTTEPTTTATTSDSTTTTTGTGTPLDTSLILMVSIASVAVILVVVFLIFKKR
jgi:parallel beta-helix repeat protein